MGQVGRFAATDGACYARRSRVVCRTARGLEVGEVLGPSAGTVDSCDGRLLRRVTVQDELLITRIERRRNVAFQACTALLASEGVPAVLVDVEHLFDGQSLFFYFLGETPPEAAALTDRLAETYEAEVQFRSFTETVAVGCGSDCGTEGSSRCGSGCATCAVAGTCAVQAQETRFRARNKA